MILYRPGEAPLDAPSVPIVVPADEVGRARHDGALAQWSVRISTSPADQAWRASTSSYRSRIQSALDGLDLTDMPADWRATMRAILQNNLAFIDECLAKGVDLVRRLETFSAKQVPS